MANPSFLYSVKLPMTPKPTMSSVGDYRATYNDIFNLQNTIRILMRSLVEEAPLDGVQYGRQNGEWTEIEGGGGGIPEAPIDGKTYGRKDASWAEVTSSSSVYNLFITGNTNGTNNNYRGYTLFVRLPAFALLGIAPKWVFTLWLQATAAFSLGFIELLKTPIGSLTVTGRTIITVGGSAAPVITPPSSALFPVVVDPITTMMDGQNDYWISVYFPTTNAVNNNVGAIDATSYVLGNFALGSFSNPATIPVGATTRLMVTHVHAVP